MQKSALNGQKCRKEDRWRQSATPILVIDSFFIFGRVPACPAVIGFAQGQGWTVKKPAVKPTHEFPFNLVSSFLFRLGDDEVGKFRTKERKKNRVNQAASHDDHRHDLKS